MDTEERTKRRIIIMENHRDKNKPNYLRWFISIVLFIVLFIHPFFYKAPPSSFHFIILGVLLIFGVVDRFKVIKIPGFIELKDKTETLEKRLDSVVNQMQQIQTQGVNVYLNPQQQTGTSQSIETKPGDKKAPQTENK